MKVKIIGAGSIGNHLAQACRRAKFDVTVVDKDPEALKRMKEDIYPSRYGKWDESIKQYVSGDEPEDGYDIIMIGTPPDTRLKIAFEALKEKPKILQLEKPLSAPFDPNLKKFITAYRKQKSTAIIMGYDHAIAKSINFVAGLLKKNTIGEVVTLDVEFREHWQGIFNAHPWLNGPQDTYLGYWKRGGGASGEHSHALHLWQYLAKISGLGQWKKISATLNIEKDGKTEYDSIASFSFVTDKGKVGRVVQDVVTKPHKKHARLQGKDGYIDWICGGAPEGDLVRWQDKKGKVQEKVFAKKRPDDFYAEVLHIKDIVSGKVKAEDSPISIESGVSVMNVLESAWDKPNSKVGKLK